MILSRFFIINRVSSAVRTYKLFEKTMYFILHGLFTVAISMVFCFSRLFAIVKKLENVLAHGKRIRTIFRRYLHKLLFFKYFLLLKV